MSNLLTLKYWFDFLPGPFLPQYSKFIYGVVILILIAGFMAWFFSEKNKKDALMYKFWNTVQLFCFVTGLLAALLVFARQQRISFLGMPFLMLLLFVAAISWAYIIFRYITKTIPKRRKEQEEKALKEKYL